MIDDSINDYLESYFHTVVDAERTASNLAEMLITHSENYQEMQKLHLDIMNQLGYLKKLFFIISRKYNKAELDEAGATPSLDAFLEIYYSIHDL